MAPNQLTRLIGESKAIMEVQDQVSKVAPLNRPVLIIGERGTGKELIAERLHYLSARWDQPYIKMNCAAISESLLESELFGHEAGAFTGASRARPGRFERAHGGSLFLDELATMADKVQEKILRVLEYGELERLGGQQAIQTDVRLIAATNVDLPHKAHQGEFREDLLDRLSFDVITLPPLRARASDILILAEQFALKMSLELEWPLFAGFSDQAMDTLMNHPWPGNVRELKNTVERSLYRHEDPGTPVSHIVLDPFESPWRPKASNQAKPSTQVIHSDLPFVERIAALEQQLLSEALDQHQHNQKQTADALGMTYHQLRGYLRKYQMVGKSS